MAEVKTVKTEPAGDASGKKNQSRPSNLCCYSQRVCNLEKLKGFDFCHKHILEDKASPFKPCDFYAKINDKRCMNPAPKMSDKEKSYCLIHTRKAELRRVVEKRKKKRQRENSNTVEDDGEGSAIGKRRRTSSCASHKSLDGSQRDDEGQSSDEDLSAELGVGGSLKVDSAWHGDVDSDAESVDSEEEDYLRHAGTWTHDEVTKMCVDKMTRLKSLYMAQYKRLFHVLKEKRRKYLQLIQAEQENEGERYYSPSEALGTSTHSKRHGVEAILHKQAKEKRHGIRHQSSTHQRCTHVSDGTRCSNKILPLTKFCIHHISHDPNQLLFQSCSFKAGDDKPCSNVVPKVYSYSTCQLHMSLNAEPLRTNVEKDLEDAVKRDLERKADEESLKDVKGILKPFPDVSEITIPDKQLPIPKALQQKSSALIPPLAPVSNHPSDIPDNPCKDSTTSKSKHHSVPNLKLEKMDPESSTLDQIASVGSTESTPMELMSPASGHSTPAGIKSISPTLLAASLVAVCSAAPSPSATSAQASSSTDLTSLDTMTTASLQTSRVVPSTSTLVSDASMTTTTSTSASHCIVTSTSTSVISSEPSTCTSDTQGDAPAKKISMKDTIMTSAASTSATSGSSSNVAPSVNSSESTSSVLKDKCTTEDNETQVTSSTSLNTSSSTVTTNARLQAEPTKSKTETSTTTQSTPGNTAPSSGSSTEMSSSLPSQTEGESTSKLPNKSHTTKDT